MSERRRPDLFQFDAAQGLVALVGGLNKMAGQLRSIAASETDLRTVTVTVPEDIRGSRYVGEIGQPAFEGSWTNYGDKYETAGFRIDLQGVVHLFGLIKNGSLGSTAFTLPEGYRPAMDHTFGTEAGNVHARLDIATDGKVTPLVGSNAWYSLSGITFDASSPAAPGVWSGLGWPIEVTTSVQRPIGVSVVSVFDEASGGQVSFGPISLDWQRSAPGLVRLRAVHGLTSGRKYELVLRIDGDVT